MRRPHEYRSSRVGYFFFAVFFAAFFFAGAFFILFLLHIVDFCPGLTYILRSWFKLRLVSESALRLSSQILVFQDLGA